MRKILLVVLAMALPAIAGSIHSGGFIHGVGAPSVGHSATISWTRSVTTDAIGYNVYRSTTLGGPYTLLNTSMLPSNVYLDLDVTAGQIYYYVATAIFASGESEYSTEVSATIPTP